MKVRTYAHFVMIYGHLKAAFMERCSSGQMINSDDGEAVHLVLKAVGS